MKCLFAVTFVLCTATFLSATAEFSILLNREFVYNDCLALPFICLYKDMRRANTQMCIFLLDEWRPDTCYNKERLGALYACISQADLFGNSIQIFEGDNCTGRSTVLTPQTNRECLDFWTNCPQDGGNWNDNVRSIRVVTKN